MAQTDSRLVQLIGGIEEFYRVNGCYPDLDEADRRSLISLFERVIAFPESFCLYVGLLDEPVLSAESALEERTLSAILDGRWRDVEDRRIAALVIRPFEVKRLCEYVRENIHLSSYWSDAMDRIYGAEADFLTYEIKPALAASSTEKLVFISPNGPDVALICPRQESEWSLAISAYEQLLDDWGCKRVSVCVDGVPVEPAVGINELGDGQFKRDDLQSLVSQHAILTLHPED